MYIMMSCHKHGRVATSSTFPPVSVAIAIAHRWLLLFVVGCVPFLQGGRLGVRAVHVEEEAAARTEGPGERT